jgi:hypothetical protein
MFLHLCQIPSTKKVAAEVSPEGKRIKIIHGPAYSELIHHGKMPLRWETPDGKNSVGHKALHTAIAPPPPPSQSFDSFPIFVQHARLPAITVQADWFLTSAHR